MEAFDELWHRAEAGLYPEPRFEPAVDTSAGASGITAHRMDGLAEMQRLTAYIGRQAQALLKMRIVDRMEVQAIARIGDRDPEGIGALIHAAIDGVAAFYGFGRPAPRSSTSSRCWPRPDPFRPIRADHSALRRHQPQEHTMTKAELVQAIATAAGVTKSVAEKVLAAQADVARNRLKSAGRSPSRKSASSTSSATRRARAATRPPARRSTSRPRTS